MVSRGVTPAGNNSVLRTGLGGTQSATLRINRWPRFPPSEPLNTESLNNAATCGSAAPPGSAQRIHATHPDEAIEVAIVVLNRGRLLARRAKATYVFFVITLDKNRVVGGVLLTLLADRHRLTEAMSVLRRAHGKALTSSWQDLGASEAEDTTLYDAWLEHRGLAAALEAVESEINGIRHGDFSLA